MIRFRVFAERRALPFNVRLESPIDHELLAIGAVIALRENLWGKSINLDSIRVQLFDSPEIHEEHLDATGVDCMDPSIIVNEQECNVGAHEFLVNFKNRHEVAALFLAVLLLRFGLHELHLIVHGENVSRFVQSKHELLLCRDVLWTP